MLTTHFATRTSCWNLVAMPSSWYSVRDAGASQFAAIHRQQLENIPYNSFDQSQGRRSSPSSGLWSAEDTTGWSLVCRVSPQTRFSKKHAEEVDAHIVNGLDELTKFFRSRRQEGLVCTISFAEGKLEVSKPPRWPQLERVPSTLNTFDRKSHNFAQIPIKKNK